MWLKEKPIKAQNKSRCKIIRECFVFSYRLARVLLDLWTHPQTDRQRDRQNQIQKKLFQIPFSIKLIMLTNTIIFFFSFLWLFDIYKYIDYMEILNIAFDVIGVHMCAFFSSLRKHTNWLTSYEQYHRRFLWIHVEMCIFSIAMKNEIS